MDFKSILGAYDQNGRSSVECEIICHTGYTKYKQPEEGYIISYKEF
jgi:hypothetical protein